MDRPGERLVLFRFVRIARFVGIAAAYVVACRVMLAPIFNFGAVSSATYEGDARLVVWALAWDNHAVTSGLPLFDANFFYPAASALAYGEHFFGISVFSLPVFVLSHNPVLAYNLVWLLSYLLSGAAVHVLTWRLTRDHVAALVSGLTYTFSFYRMHHGHGHLHLMWGFWIPVSLMLMERWIERLEWRALGLLVVALVLQALASWYQAVLIFVADALLMVWLVLVEPFGSRWREWTRDRVSRLLTQASVGAAVAIACVWPFARHYLTFASGGPAEAGASSADLTGLLMPPENTFLGQWLLHAGVTGPRSIWGELTIYVGWGTLLIAVAGATAAVAGRPTWARRFRFFVLLGIVATALAWGPNAKEIADNAWHWSAFGTLAHIPGADLFRAPARFAALLTLALSALTGAACAIFHEHFVRAGRWVTVLVIPVLLAEFYVVKFPSGQPPPFPVPMIYRSVATLPMGPVVSIPDYASGPAWFKEPNYQYFSTAHWFPIVNGYSRSVPPGFPERMHRLSTFPGPDAIETIRETGIRYVVVHAREYPDGPAAVERARTDERFRLVSSFDADFLFEFLPR